MIKFYKNQIAYKEEKDISRNTASSRVNKLIENGDIIEIPKGTKYLYLGEFKKFYESE